MSRTAARLAGMSFERPVVHALPRGGVPVGLEVALAPSAPLDLAPVRKIGAPGHPELALGAVAGGAAPHMVINEDFRQLTDEETMGLPARSSGDTSVGRVRPRQRRPRHRG